ncbi:HdaA/DnaA family protein [Candidatus Terasakiella magnetica]|uniref:HdaA/DnaA family protein n=1 Tax=Candidatus Terasakiella magnetica TaxID=1867952 RepID=UPI000F83102F|nr:DnaA/Hda family protein [Candidatus Terasakiella magnetica]
MCSSNAEAVAWLDKWPDWSGAPFVVIYGQPGCGKTHLAEVFRQATGAQALKLCQDPYETMGEASVGVLEDVDRLIADHQKDLFHLYNHAKEKGLTLLLSARTAPAQWQITLPDLKTRMGAVPVVEIGQPDDMLMEAVLVKLFSDRQLKVERDVIAFMLLRMERSFEQAIRLVQEIDRRALSEKRKITVPLARSVLQNLS